MGGIERGARFQGPTMEERERENKATSPRRKKGAFYRSSHEI
jgi:hypothetical protein